MPIKINKVKNGYIANVTPPHDNGKEWQNGKPLGVDKLIDELLKLGCHQQDIGDAFYEADPDWLDK